MDAVNNYHEGHDPPRHPMSFPVEPEFDQDRLETEFRRNQQLGLEKGYIGEGTVEAVDPAAIEDQYQAWASSEEGQQAWLEAEQQRRLEEELTGDCPFFKNAPVSHKQPIQPSCASRFIAQEGILSEQKSDPEHHEAPAKLPTHTEKPPSPYDLVQWLIHNFSLVHAGGTLYIYDGKYYVPRQTTEVDRFIVEHCRGSVQRAGTGNYVQQVRKMLLLEPKICRNADLHCNTVAFDDCLLDLEQWEIRPHSPDIFVTTRLLASFEKGKTGNCPVFQQMLATVTGGDTTLQQRIWESLGYLLVPDQGGKCFILFQGVPNSGKSVLGNFLRSRFPERALSALELNVLGEKFAMSDLVGKKLCLDMDLPANPFKPRAISNDFVNIS